MRAFSAIPVDTLKRAGFSDVDVEYILDQTENTMKDGTSTPRRFRVYPSACGGKLSRSRLILSGLAWLPESARLGTFRT